MSIKAPKTEKIEGQWRAIIFLKISRTKIDRSCELKSIEFEYKRGKRCKIASSSSISLATT